jgi:beta-mannosidase
MKVIPLNSDWHIRHSEKNLDLVADAPITVFEVLMRDQLIPDPFYGRNEHDVAWVYNSDWIFEKTFELPPDMLNLPQILLHCEGLDTIAVLELNGQPIGAAENMHRTYEFSIKHAIKPGKNLLIIKFKSPTRAALDAQAAYGVKFATASYNLPGIPYLRKAQYAFGWDWGPKLPDIGIWRPISIIAYEDLRITHVFPVQKITFEPTPKSGEDLKRQAIKVDLAVKIECTPQISPELRDTYAVNVCITDSATGKIVAECNGPVHENIFELQTHIDHPRLWWTHDLGETCLYNVHTTLIRRTGNITVQEIDQPLGIRQIELVRDKDQWGESFYFRLNTIPVFAKGANWIPVDNFIPRGMRLGLYESNVLDAKAANMNCIRVWGGGTFEDDRFYNLCDRHGLLVWQDFPFACAIYPPTQDFVHNVQAEAIDNIKRLRIHPSLALWCGNNEIEQLYSVYSIFVRNLKKKRDFKKGYLYLFEELLPRLTSDYDGTRSYWPSSPSNGGGKRKRGAVSSNNPNMGDSHYWMVWHGGRPFTSYRKFPSRFMSEFGFESFPSMATIETFAKPEDYDFLSPVMNNHQKNSAGNKKILDYMKKRFSIPKTFEQQVVLSQLTHAEAMEYGVEHWRRNRNDFHCMGSIYWQLNDCWPVASWASLDYYGRWKALHYFAKRFYTPVFPSAEETKKKVDLWVTNDLTRPISGEMIWKIYHASGKLWKSGNIPISVNPCYSEMLESIELGEIQKSKAKLDEFLIVYSLQLNPKIPGSSDNLTGFRLLGTPKEFPLVEPKFTTETRIISENNQEILEVSISCDQIALYVYAEAPGIDFLADDMFFALYPGARRTIRLQLQPIHSKLPPDPTNTMRELQAKIRIKSLFDLR